MRRELRIMLTELIGQRKAYLGMSDRRGKMSFNNKSRRAPVRVGGFFRAALCGGSALVLSGCMIGPNYKQPSLWSPKGYDARHDNGVAQPGQAVASRVVSDAPDPSWWDAFHDTELSSLERRVATQNLDVRVSTARLAESRAQLLIEGANRYPSLNATGSYSRQQYSSKEVQYGLSRVAGKLSGVQGAQLLEGQAGNIVVPQLNMWSDQIDATYEVDLWGRVARQYEAAKANLDASDEARRSVLIAQEADLARDYMTLRGQQEQLRILQDNAKTQGDTVRVSEERFRGGLVTDLDVTSARAQLDSTQAQIVQYEQQIAQQMNAISLLLGEPPGGLDSELKFDPGIPVVPPRVPVGVPSELAHRRPDIRQAEAQLHAAVAQVGQAQADFYPKVTINAGMGFQSLSFRDLGFWNARAWNVGPSISLPIFQGGQLRGTLQLRKFEEKEAAVNYQQTVLGAWRDVDNALIAYRDEQAHRDALQAGVEQQGRALSLAQEQYRHGLVTYLNVLNAQSQLLSAQMNLASSTQTIANDLVQLYNALGGGWETVYPATTEVSAR